MAVATGSGGLVAAGVAGTAVDAPAVPFAVIVGLRMDVGVAGTAVFAAPARTDVAVAGALGKLGTLVSRPLRLGRTNRYRHPHSRPSTTTVGMMRKRNTPNSVRSSFCFMAGSLLAESHALFGADALTGTPPHSLADALRDAADGVSDEVVELGAARPR